MVTLLKNIGYWTFDSLLNGRASMRLRELEAVGVMPINRKIGGSYEAYLLSVAYYDAKVAAFEAAIAALPKQSMHQVPDDFLGKNVYKLVDLIQGRKQVEARAELLAHEGSSDKAYAGYSFVNTKKYFLDERAGLPYSAEKGGRVMGYLVHPAVYAAMEAAPVAGGYVGTGDGTMTGIVKAPIAGSEIITVTCTAAVVDGGTFSVVGSGSGAFGTATVGVPFVQDQIISFLINDGATDFIVGDAFTINI